MTQYITSSDISTMPYWAELPNMPAMTTYSASGRERNVSAAVNAVLVDVREADEYAAGHIPGAVNVPLSNIAASALPKDRPLFLYCLRGARSKRAVRILRQKGFTQVKSIGGIAAYQGQIEAEK